MEKLNVQLYKWHLEAIYRTCMEHGFSFVRWCCWWGRRCRPYFFVVLVYLALYCWGVSCNLLLYFRYPSFLNEPLQHQHTNNNRHINTLSLSLCLAHTQVRLQALGNAYWQIKFRNHNKCENWICIYSIHRIIRQSEKKHVPQNYLCAPKSFVLCANPSSIYVHMDTWTHTHTPTRTYRTCVP